MDLDDVEVESLEFEDFEKIQSFSQNALKGFFMEQNKNRGEVMDEYQKNKMLLKTVNKNINYTVYNNCFNRKKMVRKKNKLLSEKLRI